MSQTTTFAGRARQLLLIMIATLAALVAVSAPAGAVELTSTTTVISTSVRPNAANCSPGISSADCSAAATVYNFATSHNYSPPSGYSGGSVYENTTGLLPAGGNYREYDIYKVKPRASERLVIDIDNPEGNSWFTPDHYDSFVQFYLEA